MSTELSGERGLSQCGRIEAAYLLPLLWSVTGNLQRQRCRQGPESPYLIPQNVQDIIEHHATNQGNVNTNEKRQSADVNMG